MPLDILEKFKKNPRYISDEPKLIIIQLNEDNKNIIENNLKRIIETLKHGDTLEINRFLYRFKTDTIIYRNQKVDYYKFYYIYRPPNDPNYFAESIFPTYIGFFFNNISKVFEANERMEMEMFLDEHLFKENPRYIRGKPYYGLVRGLRK